MATRNCTVSPYFFFKGNSNRLGFLHEKKWHPGGRNNRREFPHEKVWNAQPRNKVDLVTSFSNRPANILKIQLILCVLGT